MIAELKLYIAHLLIYDYMALGLIGFLFLLLLILSLFFIHRTLVFLFLFLLAWGTLLALPFVAKEMIDTHIRKIESSNVEVKNLIFAKSTVVTLHLENKGKVDTKVCGVQIKVVKKGNNPVQALLYPYKPIRTKTQLLDGLSAGASTDIRIVLDDLNIDEKHMPIARGYCY